MTLQLGHDVIRAMSLGGQLASEAWLGGKRVWKRTTEGIGGFTVFTEDTDLIVPAYAELTDVVGIGGGGGGAGGNGLNNHGHGGLSGAWYSTVWYAAPGRTLQIRIGKGGAGGKGGGTGAPGAGGETTVTNPTDDWRLTCAGGASDNGTGGDGSGWAVNPYTFGDVVFPGVAGAARGQAGKIPGGGGGGGQGNLIGGKNGAPGGRGQVWIRFRSY